MLQESLNETQETLNTEYIKDLRTSEEQLCFLVESFIKTARLEQGIIQVHTQKENLVETILNALGQIQKKAEEKDIYFQVELRRKSSANMIKTGCVRRFIMCLIMQSNIVKITAGSISQ